MIISKSWIHTILVVFNNFKINLILNARCFVVKWYKLNPSSSRPSYQLELTFACETSLLPIEVTLFDPVTREQIDISMISYRGWLWHYPILKIPMYLKLKRQNLTWNNLAKSFPGITLSTWLWDFLFLQLAWNPLFYFLLLLSLFSTCIPWSCQLDFFFFWNQ